MKSPAQKSPPRGARFPRLLLLGGLLLLSGGLASAQDCSAYNRVLFIGDSITKHGPNEKLNWTGNWGMAATEEAKDYVHVFTARLTQAHGGNAPVISVIAEGGGKITGDLLILDKYTAFHADLAIVQLGENDNADVSQAGFQAPYEQILAAVRAGNPQARLLCTSTWGHGQKKDEFIQAACARFGASYADIAALTADKANSAGDDPRFTHPGVKWHPSDAGMAGYAQALWTALSAPAPAPLTPAPLTPAATSTPPTATATSGPAPIDETWSPASPLAWTPAPTLDPKADHPVAQFVATDPAKAAQIMAPLDPAAWAGHTLVLDTRVRGNNLSTPPKHWNGIKITLRVQNAEGKFDYPQAYPPSGTFDWTPVHLVVPIPANTVGLAVSVGLENVTGEVDIDALHISSPAAP